MTGKKSTRERFTDKEEWIMTNYESIKAMGMNELAGFLASITTCFDCPARNCARNCASHDVCTATLLEWLNAESDDDTLVEQTEGQPIKIFLIDEEEL